MNRIQPPVRSPQLGPAQYESQLGLARFSGVSRDVPHALFAPQHYEPNYAYPLIVWLHGPADDERQLLRIMPLVSMRNYVAVAPRGVSGRGPSDTQRPAWLPWCGAASRAEQCVFDSIHIALQKYRISPKRVFVAGFDTGGTMAFHLALNYPQYFAGALSFCGAFPIGRKSLRHLAEARRLSVFVAAGRDSSEYPPEKVCDDLRLLHTAGLSITLRQYPCGQELAPQMLQDMDRWVIEQITQQTEQPAA
jgi:phospholipase/carboxylesterase